MSKLSDSDIVRLLENSDEDFSDEEPAFACESPIVYETLDDISDFINETSAPSQNYFEEEFIQGNDRPALETREIVNHNDWSLQIQNLLPEEFSCFLFRQNIHFGSDTELYTIFRQILSDNVLELMVEQTNIYGIRLKNEPRTRNQTKARRIDRWKDVTTEELLKFIGILLLTGLVSLPTLESYWKKDLIYYHPLLHKINMSYNRFCIILRCWHFVDNDAPRENDRLYKIRPLIDLIIKNSRQIYTPGRTVVVDESMVPFRGRLLFKQYIPSKAHKYGVKVYKLCSADGYVWSYEIYSGESHKIVNLDVSGSIVVRLAEELLNEGRLIITDNYYTSVSLAEYLKDHNTDLLGTVRKNRRGLPKPVIDSKLKKGELAAMQKNTVTVVKWHDKRDVCLLSTCHGIEMKKSTGRCPTMKPQIVLEYNKGKKGIDLSDQLSSYNSPSRKTMIWYKKIATDLMSIAVINSLLIYNELREERRKKLSVLGAYETLIRRLLQIEVEDTPLSRPLPIVEHAIEKITKKPGQKSAKKRCVGCYQRQRNLFKQNAKDAAAAAAKVTTWCAKCKKAFCLGCFNTFHNIV